MYDIILCLSNTNTCCRIFSSSVAAFFIGYGRFSIQLFPQNNGDPGFIFKFKHGKNADELDGLAKEALQQIEEQKYDI